MKELIYHRHLLQRAEWHADKVGFIDGAYRGTYAGHVDRVARLCAALANLGIEKHDRFAVMALNGHCFLELYHAAYLGAGVINPMNLRLAAKELEYILRDSATKVCFADAMFAPLIDQVRKAAGIEQVVLIGAGDVPHDHRYEHLLEAALPRIPDEPEETDPVVLMYTGGTTGLPKGVLLDQRAEMLNYFHAGMVWPMGESDTVFLHQTPMFHAASMLSILSAPLGGTSVFMPYFDAAKVPSLIEQEGVTMTAMVPTMIHMMLSQPDFAPERLRSLQVLSYGASPMPEALLQRLMKLLPNLDIFQGYGMTESASVLTALRPEDHRAGGELLRSAGRALPGVVLTIQDDRGNVLPPRHTGEVCARGGNYMQKYWKKRAETEEVFRGGWYHTGDAGYLDERGYLYLVDRVKDMIVSGGENVYSSEVEQAICSHPAVAQVAVIGIPDDTWGEAVHAIVVPHAEHSPTADEIIDHARRAIAGYKLPKSVEFRAQPLPLSGAMKVLKRELRAPYWEGRTRRVN
ncbi:MAG TPA: long-chain-fatty-acid--CoA ligase [Polyangiaceae bacterium]|nr:long-chain-fatty-acid--CoA ligase [Polyangiaceae bacterium]